MMSKWEWIEKACVENGFKRSAIIANEIETLLKRLYCNTKTKEWENDHEAYVFDDAEEIDFLRSSPEYCIACVESQNCEDCLLAIGDFRCSNEKSLYRKFTNVFWKEAFKK